jgi:diadenosine tetraphosphate (Ap4A) HIT family hydrolase
MTKPDPSCLICRGIAGDAEFQRVEVWQDSLWRFTVSLAAEVPGFAYLEPKRHIPDIAQLDGEEAATFGPVMAKVTAALKAETGAELVYVYIFGGGIPHLHVHLAPHRAGDALNEQMIRGELTSEKLPSGVEMFVSREFPPLPREELAAVAGRVAERLGQSNDS